MFTSLISIPGKETRSRACCSISADYCVLSVRQVACRHVALSAMIIVYCR